MNILKKLFEKRIVIDSELKERIVEIVDSKGEISGRELQRLLNWDRSKVVFYRLMAELEDEDRVEGFWAIRDIDGYMCRGRSYKKKWIVHNKY